MAIKSIRWKKWVTVAVVLGMIALGPGIFFGHRFWKEINQWIEAQQRWAGYRMEDGVVAELAKGRIRKGDNLEEILKRFPLVVRKNELITRREDFGPWTIVNHQSATEPITIIARDQKILAAGIYSCCFQDVFIPEQLTAEEIAEIDTLRTQSRELRMRTRSTLYSFLTGNAARCDFDEHGKLEIVPPLEN